MTKRRPSSDWQLDPRALGKPLDAVKLRLVAINSEGRIIGDGHHRCTISDETVTEIRDLYEYGKETPRQLAARFSLKLGTVQELLKYRRRADVPREWKKMQDGE
jgi:hypothetical protein